MNNSIQLIRCTKGLIYDQLLFLTTFTTSFFLSNYQNGLFLIKILIDALLFHICRVLVFNFFLENMQNSKLQRRWCVITIPHCVHKLYSILKTEKYSGVKLVQMKHLQTWKEKGKRREEEGKEEVSRAFTSFALQTSPPVVLASECNHFLKGSGSWLHHLVTVCSDNPSSLILSLKSIPLS